MRGNSTCKYPSCECMQCFARKASAVLLCLHRVLTSQIGKRLVPAKVLQSRMPEMKRLGMRSFVICLPTCLQSSIV